jgi:hypothetical protein
MKSQVKAIRCFQNNGPAYWNIYDGVKVFGVKPIATLTLRGALNEGGLFA